MTPPGAMIVVNLSLLGSLANASIEVNSTAFETLLIINRADNPIRSLIPTPVFSIHKNMRQSAVLELKGGANPKPALTEEDRRTWPFEINRRYDSAASLRSYR